MSARRLVGADDDPGYGRRLVLAIAAAVALHLLVAAFAPDGRRSEAREDVTSALPITVAVRTPPPTARPSPTPTPRPSPPPVSPAPHPSLAPRVIVRAALAATVQHRHAGGAASPRRRVASAAEPVSSPVPAAPATDGAGAGRIAGGAGAGAGPGTGDGGLAGSGAGTGTAGAGNGTADAGPCGDVFLLPGSLAYRKDGTVVQQVLAKIVARNGTVTVDRFPYPFVYAAAKLNPFRYDTAVTGPNGGIPVQQPPPGTDVSTLPLGIQTVLRYTDPKTGYTSLPACNPAATPH